MLYSPDLSVEIKAKQPLVLFDGECSLCSSSVRFLIRHNKKCNLNFASLQSETGLTILKNAGENFQQSNTILFYENNTLYSYSAATLKIATHLSYPWRMLGIFTVIPSGLRDLIYRFVAKNRYKWFGRKSYCMTADEDIRARLFN